MSGVTGSERIKSRKSYNKILDNYREILKYFPGFISVNPSGSYNSDQNKKTFGDMDLIFHVDGGVYNFDKKLIKLKLIEYLKNYSDKIVVPFTSEKYYGRRHYNSGEIVTINYKIKNSSIAPCQIDNIIAIDEEEAEFKTNFLDLPAEKQGLVIGLIKSVILEEDFKYITKRLGIGPIYSNLTSYQEYEFNLSSSKLELRKVSYIPKTYKQTSREVVWTSKSWMCVLKLLQDYNLDMSFEELLEFTNRKLQNKRSAQRIKGMFNAMISIKSGEVGTKKGEDKQKAIDKINKTFSDTEQNPTEKFNEVRDLFKDFKFFKSVELKDEWTIRLNFRTNRKLFSAIRQVQQEGLIAGMVYTSTTDMSGKAIDISIPRSSDKFKIGDEVKIFNDNKPFLDNKKWKISLSRWGTPRRYNHFTVEEINKKLKYKITRRVASYDLERV